MGTGSWVEASLFNTRAVVDLICSISIFVRVERPIRWPVLAFFLLSVLTVSHGVSNVFGGAWRWEGVFWEDSTLLEGWLLYGSFILGLLFLALLKKKKSINQASLQY